MTKLLTEEQEEHYGPNGIGFDPSKLVVKCGPADERDERLVIASLYGATHRDKFNTDESWKRQKFREKFSSLCGCETPEFFEAVEAEIMAKADAADAISDAASGPLWTPSLVSLADIETKDVRWFWPGVMPEGAITVLDSDPGEGKSTITDDVAARYSAGNSMPPHSAPDGTFAPGNVLILDGEEDVQRTRKPRLVAAGADVNRIYFLRTTTMEDDERFIQLPLDLAMIEQVVVEKEIGLIIIDVLATFIQDGTSMNDDAAMRKLTGPLANMLERTRATAIVLRHLNKKENLRGMYRGGGSIAIVAAAR
ncbi:MAG TPA: AAA family ATPase, partial [Pirellulaceae bacterium]|nr:AAA family ATPase [Pirellulaceae bacterium]